MVFAQTVPSHEAVGAIVHADLLNRYEGSRHGEHTECIRDQPFATVPESFLGSGYRWHEPRVPAASEQSWPEYTSELPLLGSL